MKKKNITLTKTNEFASPYFSKRNLGKTPAQIGNLMVTPMSPGKIEMNTPKTLRGDFMKGLLQTNSNHISSHHTLKRNLDENPGASLKDQIKNAVSNKDSDQKSSSSYLTESVASPRQSQRSVNSPLMSPNTASSHINKVSMYREMAQNRRSRFSTNTNPFAQAKPVEAHKQVEEHKIIEESDAPVTRTKKRSNSLSVLKTFHVEESPSSRQFPSLLEP